jgi:predicted transcriptional regulator
MPKEHSKQDRRQYIRLDSVFPIEFNILSLDSKEVLSDWMQGFTNNIGKGGLCLEVKKLPRDLAQIIKSKKVKLALAIEIPLGKNPVKAIAHIAWVQDVAGEPERYLIGLTYEEIVSSGKNRIMRYAWTKKFYLPVAMAAIITLGLGFAISGYANFKLIQDNKKLVEQFVKVLQESSIAKQKVKEINREKELLQLKIQALELRITTVEEDRRSLQDKIGLEVEKVVKETEELDAIIQTLSQEKTSLQEQLISVQNKENSVAEELLRLDKRKATLEKANIDKMYRWLTIRQNSRTGLVMSFEGDKDISKWAFIYDQALAAQVFINFSDFERAKKILDFFNEKAKRNERLFFNSYYSDDGEPSEYIVYSGPNIWVGIAILQFAKKTQDYSCFNLAEDIASSIIELQSEDPDGGIRGGPNVEWFATEHNLDAYAFFDMLYKSTGKKKYVEAKDKVLNWLIKHAYDTEDIPIKRGKGDSTIATDTYAWSIAAIGPEKLEQLDMIPDRILEFVEQNCSIEVAYERSPGQIVKIRGFDFAPERHTARGGVVSAEWTAQMVLSYKIVSEFYYKKGLVAKARAYALKADEYFMGLGNMIISSSSASGQGASCLPYANQDFVDTGHGWMTPKGKSTGSVAATSYFLLAYYNYNPLAFKE